jgi:hypothetical protein
MRFELFRRDEVHETKPARIVEDDDVAGGHPEDDVIVRIEC